MRRENEMKRIIVVVSIVTRLRCWSIVSAQERNVKLDEVV